VVNLIFAQSKSSPTEAVCKGELRSYRIVGQAGSTINWSLPVGGVIVDDGADKGSTWAEPVVFNATESVYESKIQIRWTGASATAYTLEAWEVGGNGCESERKTLSITIYDRPNISSLDFSLSPTVICKNSAPVMNITGLAANTKYTIGYNDNGSLKTANITTNGSGNASISGLNPVIATSTYNITSVSFNDSFRNCEANPGPSLTAKSVSIEKLKPVVNCPSALIRRSASGLACDYTVAGAELNPTSVTDNCSLASVTNNINSTNSLAGESFSIGNHTITWTATDVSGNTSSCSFTLIVEDKAAPLIVGCPTSPIEEEKTNSCNFAIKDYTKLITVTDNCGGAVNIVQSPAPGTLVTVNTNVQIVATDGAGNSSSCNFEVRLVDKIKPIISDLSSLNADECADSELISPQVSMIAGLNLTNSMISDNCTADVNLRIQYRIKLPDSSFANNWGVKAPGANSASDPSAYAFPQGNSEILYRIIDEAGNISNVKVVTIRVRPKPNPGEIEF
jgi:hypothetical protein